MRRDLQRRLCRLEAFGTEATTRQICVLEARLEGARLRSGLPAPSAERLAQLRGMSIVEILHAARQRVRQSSLSVAGERPVSS